MGTEKLWPACHLKPHGEETWGDGREARKGNAPPEIPHPAAKPVTVKVTGKPSQTNRIRARAARSPGPALQKQDKQKDTSKVDAWIATKDEERGHSECGGGTLLSSFAQKTEPSEPCATAWRDLEGIVLMK